MSREGQQRGHTSLGVPTTAVLGIQGEPGVVPSSHPTVVGDPPASFTFRGGSAAPGSIKLRKTAEEGENCQGCSPFNAPPNCAGTGHALHHHSLSLGSLLLRGLCGGPAPAEGGTGTVRAAAAVDKGSCRAGGWMWGGSSLN